MIDWLLIVFAQYASNQMPLLVGKILELVPREEGNEEVFQRYSPARVLASGQRSKCVKGSWSPDVDAANHPLSHKGTESVGPAYFTFERLLSSNKLPQTVWDAVAAKVPPPEGEEKKEEEEEDSEAQPG